MKDTFPKAAEEILEMARDRYKLETEKPTKEVLQGLLLANGALLSRLRKAAIAALKHEARKGTQKEWLEKVRDLAIEADGKRTNGGRKAEIAYDLETVNAAIDKIAAMPLPEVAPKNWNECLQEMFALGNATSAPTPSTPLKSDGPETGGWPKPTHCIDAEEMLALACRLTGKWGLLLRTSQHGDEAGRDLVEPGTGRIRPAPYLYIESLSGTGHEMLFLLFETEEDMSVCYRATVGDDGPTELNPYDGPARIYALTCGPDGVTGNENT